MPRKLRVQYLGAIYHVMNRGDRRESIFDDDEDRRRFLETLAKPVPRQGGRELREADDFVPSAGLSPEVLILLSATRPDGVGFAMHQAEFRRWRPTALAYGG